MDPIGARNTARFVRPDMSREQLRFPLGGQAQNGNTERIIRQLLRKRQAPVDPYWDQYDQPNMQTPPATKIEGLRAFLPLR